MATRKPDPVQCPHCGKLLEYRPVHSASRKPGKTEWVLEPHKCPVLEAWRTKPIADASIGGKVVPFPVKRASRDVTVVDPELQLRQIMIADNRITVQVSDPYAYLFGPNDEK